MIAEAFTLEQSFAAPESVHSENIVTNIIFIVQITTDCLDRSSDV